MLGVILELFIVEEKLFAGCEHKISATVVALQYSVSEFHWPASLEQGKKMKSAKNVTKLPFPFSLSSFSLHNKGPGRNKVSGKLDFS
jgi:hypothetical protein